MIVPVLLLPDESMAVVPDPSSNLYQAMGVDADVTVTVALWVMVPPVPVQERV